MAERPKQNCRLCGQPTSTVYNINLEAVPVCDECGLAITKQEVATWKRED